MSTVRDRLIPALTFGTAAGVVALVLTLPDGWKELGYPGVPAIIAAALAGAWLGGNAIIKHRHGPADRQVSGAALGCGVTFVAYLLFALLSLGWAVAIAPYSLPDLAKAPFAFFYFTLIFFPLLIGIAVLGAITGHLLVRAFANREQEGAS